MSIGEVLTGARGAGEAVGTGLESVGEVTTGMTVAEVVTLVGETTTRAGAAVMTGMEIAEEQRAVDE